MTGDALDKKLDTLVRQPGDWSISAERLRECLYLAAAIATKHQFNDKIVDAVLDFASELPAYADTQPGVPECCL